MLRTRCLRAPATGLPTRSLATRASTPISQPVPPRPRSSLARLDTPRFIAARATLPHVAASHSSLLSAFARLLPRRAYSDASKPPAPRPEPRPDPFRPPQFPDDPPSAPGDARSAASDAELDSRVRFVQYQQARLSDELEQLRRAQAYDAYTRRRFWILILIVLLCLELLFPLLYYFYSEEMDADDIPERYLGQWLSAEGSEPRVYLRIHADGRVAYHRPDQAREVRGRMRRVSPKALLVNVWTTAVFDALRTDGPPAADADGRLYITVDGVRLYRHHSARAPDSFLRDSAAAAAGSDVRPPVASA